MEDVTVWGKWAMDLHCGSDPRSDPLRPSHCKKYLKSRQCAASQTRRACTGGRVEVGQIERGREGAMVASRMWTGMRDSS